MRSLITALSLAAACALAAGSASAGSVVVSDSVHADSFGNLVIHSPAGYKRIIVGMGHTADAYNLTGSYYEPEGPEVVALDGRAGASDARRCWRPPYVWHGRSHMYGLPQGIIPQAPLVCE